MKTFISQRIQPLRARSRYMYEYTGEDDETRMTSAPLAKWEAQQKVVDFVEVKDGVPNLDTPTIQSHIVGLGLYLG